MRCDFRRPLLLPSQVTFQTPRTGEGVDFRVTSTEGKPHLVGALGLAQGAAAGHPSP